MAGVTTAEIEQWQIDFGALLNGASGTMSSERISNTLFQAANDHDMMIRIRSIDLIGELKRVEFNGLLAETLKAPQAELRWHALAALENTGCTDISDHAILAAEDPDSRVRAKAIHILGVTGDKKAQKRIKEALEDRDLWVRHEARNADAVFKERKAVGICLCDLRGADPEARSAALLSLIKIGNERAALAVAELLNDRDPAIRLQAVQSLGSFTVRRGIELISRAHDDPDASVRSAATGVLGKIPSAYPFQLILSHLEDPAEEVRVAASMVLREASKSYEFHHTIKPAQVIGPVAKALGDNSRAVRENAALTLLSLGRIKPEALELLNEALKGSDDHLLRFLREWIERKYGSVDRQYQLVHVGADGLLHLGPPPLPKPGGEEVRACIASLKDPAPKVRIQAAIQLGFSGNKAGIEPLIEALEDPDEDVKRNVMSALGRIGDRSAVKTIENYICGNRISREALIALSMIGDADVDKVGGLIFDPNSFVELAMNVLDRIGSLKAIEYLVMGVDHSAYNYRQHAIDLLKKHDKQTVVDLLLQKMDEKAPPSRWYYIESLGEIYDDRVPQLLLKELAHEDSRVRLETLKALSKNGDKVAVRPLATAIRDEDSTVRVTAAAKLLEMHVDDHSAFILLVEALGDSRGEVRALALYLLGKLGDKRASEHVEKHLQESDSEVRINAMKAMARLVG